MTDLSKLVESYSSNNKKTKMPMVTKIGGMVTNYERFPPTRSHDTLIRQSC